MTQPQNINIHEETDLKKIFQIFRRNLKFFISTMILALILAFLFNRYSIPVYNISSSILIKEDKNQQEGIINDYLNSNLLGKNTNFQNELWILKSTPVVERIINNLDLTVTYLTKGRIKSFDVYNDVPFKISYLSGHPQPLNIVFTISFLNKEYFQIKAESKEASFYNYKTSEFTHFKENWAFLRNGKFGELIETPDLAFIVEHSDTNKIVINDKVQDYKFYFRTVESLRNEIKDKLNFRVIDKDATVVEISIKSVSINKGKDILNELMNVYSEHNLERKNHTARITIDYIEKQLNEISDSLSRTEDNLQSFRSSNQLLNITDQAAGISAQYLNLQDQLAEMVSRKRYFDYISELLKNDNFSNIMLPASIGIPDQLLNTMMSDLIKAQAQRSNLIENNQERNPMVQKLSIQIDNLKKTIFENISALGKSTSISIEEMNKRINKIEGDISRLPITQRKLGNIERKYRLNDAILNYLMEKHAEAKITQASNLPNNLIIESADLVGIGPITPNKPRNYLIAFILGIGLPFGFLMLINLLRNKIETTEDIERLTVEPILGKIMHNKFKTNNVMFEYSKSNIAESFRALRTNLDFYVKGGHKKILMVTSCLEGEGKSFVALNLAMSYAQLGRKTILIDFDLRKPKIYFNEKAESQEGLTSYMINKSDLKEIIKKSPHDKLDYIPSGIIPPNPVELLALDKTEELFTILKDDYDIIVLDTTPIAQVTDAYLLVDHAEIKIIIVRQSYTEKGIFSLITKDLHLKNIHNVCIVMNDNRHFQDQYGYGYGYYNKKGRFGKNKKRG